MSKKIYIKILLFLFLFTVFPILSSAKTLGQYEQELIQKQQQEAEKKEAIKRTDSEISSTKIKIQNTHTQINNARVEIEQKTKEIEELTQKILDKDAETKALMKYFQISTGESEMLEYVMGASSLTDFIYRVSIVEQLTKYNTDNINEMNKLIKENENKKIELAEKQSELEGLQVSLSKSLSFLASTKVNLYEELQTVSESIKNAQSVIAMYKKAGCKSGDDVNVCAKKLLPPDTSFWRPLTSSYISSEYGWRTSPISGRRELHPALDMPAARGTSMYPAAGGKVVKTVNCPSCSCGNQIIIHHNINGNYYTSFYCHLSSINVSQGAVVSKDTVIGYVGSTGNSTGPHLHLAISTGLWYSQYYSYSDFVARTVNPRNIINFPAGRTRWSNRTSRY